MTLSELIERAYTNAKLKGWHEDVRPSLEFHALFTSEVAEATEAVRKNSPHIYFVVNGEKVDAISLIREKIGTEGLSKMIPEGEAIELADVVIRICDFWGFQIDRFKMPELSQYIENMYNNQDRVRIIEEVVNKYYKNPLCIHQIINQLIADSSRIFSQDSENEIKWKKNYTFRPTVEAVLVIAKYFERQGWNLQEALNLKMDYNETREYRHGNKRF